MTGGSGLEKSMDTSTNTGQKRMTPPPPKRKREKRSRKVSPKPISVKATPPANGESRKETWKTRIQELQDFKREQGHCKVPELFDGNRALGKWVQKQRYWHKLRTEGKHSVLDGSTSGRARSPRLCLEDENRRSRKSDAVGGLLKVSYS
jgi:hypothetical protein